MLEPLYMSIFDVNNDPKLSWEYLPTDPISEIEHDDNSFKCTTYQQYFDKTFQECESYKVTVTFNRKFWKKGRAFKHVYVKLQEVFDASDVESGMFFMELHESGFPHVHGIVKWEKGYESPDFLRNRLVQIFGQTKIFKYDPKHFLEKSENENKELIYKTWYDYISKNYITMVEFKQNNNLNFNIFLNYNRIKYNGKYIYKESQFC